jgi:hypothetical protein
VHLRAPFLSHSEIFYSNTKWCSQRLLKIHLLFLTKRSKRQQEEWHAGSVVLNRSLTFSEFRFPLWQSVTSAPLFTPTLRVFVRTQWSSLEGIFHPIYGHPVDISQLNLCGCSLTTTARFVSNLRAWTWVGGIPKMFWGSTTAQPLSLQKISIEIWILVGNAYFPNGEPCHRRGIPETDP